MNIVLIAEDVIINTKVADYVPVVGTKKEIIIQKEKRSSIKPEKNGTS